eukprot:2168064-Pleurochrysis_carterae.AAC.3
MSHEAGARKAVTCGSARSNALALVGARAHSGNARARACVWRLGRDGDSGDCWCGGHGGCNGEDVAKAPILVTGYEVEAHSMGE